jgi:long-chain acyl-CoA synthetase
MPQGEYRERSIGLPYPDMLAKAVRPGTFDECAPMEEGEICVSGPTVMLGYLGESEATAGVLKVHPDGLTWLHSGDIGCMDPDGFFFFRQRAKRIIKTSGISVYPSTVEDVLNKHPAVKLSCVIGVPHAAQVEVPKGFVTLNSGFSPSESLEKELIEHCRSMLIPHSCPRGIEFLPDMPMTKVGKVAYRELEERERSRAERNA